MASVKLLVVCLHESTDFKNHSRIIFCSSMGKLLLLVQFVLQTERGVLCVDLVGGFWSMIYKYQLGKKKGGFFFFFRV